MTPVDLQALELGTLDPGKFDHAAHVQAAFALLDETAFVDAAARYAAAITKLASRAGRPEKFNLTITLAFLAVIAERKTLAPGLAWPEFIARNPDLLDRALLQRWYSPARLADPRSRNMFLLPEPRA